MATDPTVNGNPGAESNPTATADRLREISGGVGAKHSGRGGARPGAGNKKGWMDRKLARENGEDGLPAGSTKTQTSPPPIDRKFIEEAARTGLKSIDGIITRKVFSATCSIWPGNPEVAEQAKKFENDIALNENDIKLFAETMGAIAEKYPRLFGYAPELTLGIFGMGYGARVMMVFAEIKKLNLQVAALRAQTPPPDATPPPVN